MLLFEAMTDLMTMMMLLGCVVGVEDECRLSCIEVMVVMDELLTGQRTCWGWLTALRCVHGASEMGIGLLGVQVGRIASS